MSASDRNVMLAFTSCLFVSLGLAFAEDDVSNTSGSDELKSETHKEVVLQMKQLLQGNKIIRQGNVPIVEDLNPEPVLNWDDLVRGHHHGTLWVWGTKGRPAAIIEMYTTNFSKTLKDWPGNVVHSLAPEPLRSEGPLRWVWAPDRPGFVPKPLEGVTDFAATSRLRRLQMRSLAKRFASNESWNGDRSELRLLTTPILLYESEKEGILDGGLFVFVHGGTNPEVVLILEAIERNQEKYWQFGCVRLGHAQEQVTFDEREVWSVEKYEAPDPKSTYFSLTRR